MVWYGMVCMYSVFIQCLFTEHSKNALSIQVLCMDKTFPRGAVDPISNFSRWQKASCEQLMCVFVSNGHASELKQVHDTSSTSKAQKPELLWKALLLKD